VIHSCTALIRGRWLSLPIPGYELLQREVFDVTPCAYGSGANLMVRRGIFEAVGGWDPKYPIGMEDVDLSFSGWARGHRCLYVPSARCNHRISGSSQTRVGSLARMRGTLMGHMRFAVRHLPAPEALLVFTLTFIPGGVIDVIRGRRRRLSARIEAVTSVLKDRRSLLRDRADLRKVSGLSPRQRLRRLAGIGMAQTC
jgi:GT2 family glycosyltransferase